MTASASRQIATAAHEIVAPDGLVVAWTVDGVWAEMVVAGLARLVADGWPLVATFKEKDAPEPSGASQSGASPSRPQEARR